MILLSQLVSKKKYYATLNKITPLLAKLTELRQPKKNLKIDFFFKLYISLSVKFYPKAFIFSIWINDVKVMKHFLLQTIRAFY